MTSANTKPKYYLAFYKGTGRWDDRLIRFFTRSAYSHVELLLAGDHDHQKRPVAAISASGRDGGVRRKEIDFRSGRWDVVPVLGWAHDDAWNFAFSKLGDGYDWLAIALTFVLPLRLQSKNRWFCSELCAHAVGLTGQGVAPGDLLDRVKDMNAAFGIGCESQASGTAQ